MNLRKKWAVGTLVAVCCLADIMAPMTGLAAEVVSYSRVVSDTPGTTDQNYTGSSASSQQSPGGTFNAGPRSTTASGTYSDSSQSSPGNGPKVVDVTLTERYYEDYDIYAESINGLYYFYSNVGNNGMTNKPVSVDFPANITYTLEKDGVVMPYTSKQTVSDYGTYLFRILITEDETKPVYEQTVYRAAFIFRIQPKVEKPKEERKAEVPAGVTGNAAGLVSDIYAVSGVEDLYRQYGEQNQLGSLADLLAAAAEEMAEEKDKELVRNMARELAKEETRTEEETTASAEVESVEAAESWIAEESKPSKEPHTPEQPANKPSEQMHSAAAATSSVLASRVKASTAYVPSRGAYRTEFEDGSFLEVTSPNGLIGNTKVYVSLEGVGGQEKVTLLKNGKKEEVPQEEVFDQPGSYLLLCRTEQGVYPYSFRILDVADSYLDYYTVPEGLELTAVEIDGRNVDPGIYLDPNGVARVDFTTEGSYKLSMSDPNGLDFRAELTIDRTPPQVTVTNNKGTAYFSYNTQEVKEIILKDGKSETTFTQLDQVTAPGSYQAEFYDYAGNVTRVRFQVKRQINLATVAVIFMIIALVMLAVIFYRRTKLDMDVK